ncbi:MAG TPA: 3-keto-5-aminohexanoate cleavage protein [Steroidobacteraceae bacterium]|nr:3-keto-5-aminohexanoate cleavage protein [Steroidobacteraceae bacterium]
MNTKPSNSIPAAWRYTDTYEFMERVQQGMPPAIICVACNGGVQGKESSEALPETADEIADSVYGAYRAGASVVHVHARNPNNLTEAATTTDVWWEVNSKIRERCPEIIINNTTGGGLNSTMRDRLACLDAKPELASLNLTPDMSRFRLKERKAPLPNPRGVVEFDDCIPFSYRLVGEFARAMKERGIKPELETYHTGGAWVIRDLVEQELIRPPYYVQTVMGYQTSSFPTFENVINLVKEFPRDSIWLCSGIGPFQLPMTTFSLLLGGHVRVGLEDNLYLKRGQKLRSNTEVVERTVRIAHELNREIATPAQARQILGISPTPSRY